MFEEILKNIIIQNDKAIGFDEFMNLCLYHPQHGYYHSNLTKIGKKGDFITAPETSELFAKCIAKQLTEVLENINNKNILEFGAGNGTLCLQILKNFKKKNTSLNKYYILELSADLKNKQQSLIKKELADLYDSVIWLNKIPVNFEGIVIANEVVDAFPIKRFEIINGKVFELEVNVESDNFVYQRKVTQYKPDFKYTEFKDNYIFEDNFYLKPWLQSLYKAIRSGIVLIIDYGMEANEYYHREKNYGNLRCYFKHKTHKNPFINIGLQDITAPVNFSKLYQDATSIGFNIKGYTNQAFFLINLKIDEELKNIKDEFEFIKLNQELKNLILPNAMGEDFKVIALSKNLNVKLQGFLSNDLSHRL